MPEPICTAKDLLSALDSRECLYDFLGSKLNWATSSDDTFAYEDENAIGRSRANATLSQIIPFSAGDPFIIFLVEFKERFRRTDLREILRGVRRRVREEAAYNTADLDELVFVCTLPDGLRFVHFEEHEGRQPKMRVFGYDRDSVGETYTLRSVNLPLLRLSTNLLGEVDWNACRKNWMEAWNVEKVTKQFFRDYREVFNDVEINHVENYPGEKRLFVQRFFNRLMFIHFLSKKGWLRAPGKNKEETGREYLHDLWDVYNSRDKGKDAPGDTFYRKHLAPLFFAALNQPHVSRNSDLLAKVVGNVPYLNGGLFEELDDDKAIFTIQDGAFQKMWDRLFSCYNFTVAESTPDDQDVAVDPEMLGKVFEELVTGRHESGSYYTPRNVVQFMCREALKGYLSPCGAGIEKFVDFHDATDITNHEVVLSALKSVKVVDPACGSGAYLLGMLQELMALRLVLFNAKKLDDESSYNRKLEIIQNNIYGVDLDMFAVNTARLRLWLSLVVEQTRNPIDDKAVSVALPNLDFKIECGDSVTCPDPSGGLQLSLFRENDLREIGSKRLQYGDVAYKGNKTVLKHEIEELSRAIKVESKLTETAFDWRVDFGDVFQNKVAAKAKPDGFDIVLANPPYVRGELITDLKPALKKIYGERFSGTMDLYCFFYFRAIELLKDGGQLIFITPNKWFRAGYGEKLRATIAETCRVRSITDFGDLPVFESATAYPMIFIAQKGKSADVKTWLAEPMSLDIPYPDVRSVIDKVGFVLPATAMSSKDWNLSRSGERTARMKQNGVSLGEYVNGKIYRGILTGFNTAFMINGTKRDELIASDPKSHEIIKPFVGGRDVRRWWIDRVGTPQQCYVIYSPWELDIERYPAVKEHLIKWKSELESRPECKAGRYNWWCMSRYGSEYVQELDKPKIVYQEIATYQSFAYSKSELYINKTIFMICVDDLYLLGVLNSLPVWEFLHSICTKLQGNALTMQRPYLEQVPIPTASSKDKSIIAALVQKCLDMKGQGVKEIEAEINERVTGLYKL